MNKVIGLLKIGYQLPEDYCYFREKLKLYLISADIIF